MTHDQEISRTCSLVQATFRPMVTPGDRTRSLVGNSLASVAAQASGLVVAFFLTPYVVHSLGIELFGLWALLSAVVAYARLLMLGVGRGTIRFIAFYGGRREFDVVRSIVSYGVLSHLAAGVVLGPIGLVVAHAVIPHLNVSPSLVDTAETLTALALLYVFFAWTTRPLTALLIGLERLWITSVTTVGSQLVYAGVVVVLLTRGAGVYALVAGAFVQTGLQTLVYYIAARRLIGSVFGNPFTLDRRILREMLKFGGWFQVNAVANLVNYETDAIVIGTWVDVAATGLYAIGNRIAQLVRVIPLALLAPLLPAASALHAEGDEDRVSGTVLRGSRLVGLLSLSICGFVLATAPLITTAWLGHTYPHVAVIAELLTVAYTASNLTGVGATVSSAIGQPRHQSQYAVTAMLLNIAATLVLAPLFGLYGIVVGTVVALVASSAWFLWHFHRLMGYRLWDYLGEWLWRLASATALAAVPVLVLRVGLPASVAEQRGESLAVLAALAVLYCTLLLAFLRLLKFFHTDDLDVLMRALPLNLQPLASARPVAFLFGERARDDRA